MKELNNGMESYVKVELEFYNMCEQTTLYKFVRKQKFIMDSEQLKTYAAQATFENFVIDSNETRRIIISPVKYDTAVYDYVDFLFQKQLYNHGMLAICDVFGNQYPGRVILSSHPELQTYASCLNHLGSIQNGNSVIGKINRCIDKNSGTLKSEIEKAILDEKSVIEKLEGTITDCEIQSTGYEKEVQKLLDVLKIKPVMYSLYNRKLDIEKQIKNKREKHLEHYHELETELENINKAFDEEYDLKILISRVNEYLEILACIRKRIKEISAEINRRQANIDNLSKQLSGIENKTQSENYCTECFEYAVKIRDEIKEQWETTEFELVEKFEKYINEYIKEFNITGVSVFIDNERVIQLREPKNKDNLKDNRLDFYKALAILFAVDKLYTEGDSCKCNSCPVILEDLTGINICEVYEKLSSYKGQKIMFLSKNELNAISPNIHKSDKYIYEMVNAGENNTKLRRKEQKDVI